MQDIDVDANYPSRGDADAGLRPVAPDAHFVVGGVPLAVPAPLRVVVPGLAAIHAGLFGARLDRQDRKAVIDQGRTQLSHEIIVCHRVP